jgi:WD40-like Beta Propeller Repeat
MTHRRIAILTAVAAAVLAPAAARADVLVAYDHAVAGHGFDVAVVDLQQDGSPVTLPASVNTTANELHPSLSGDGRFLAFQRDTLAAAASPDQPPVYSRRFVLVDLHAGTVVTPAPLESSDGTQTAPWLSNDARWLISGVSGERDEGKAAATIADLDNGAARSTLLDQPPRPPADGSCAAATVCVPPGASAPGLVPPDAVPASAGSSTTSILNPVAGPGATPLLAWSRSRVTRFTSGTTAVRIDLRMQRYGSGFTAARTVDFTVPHASDEVFGHPAVANDNQVAFERLPLTSGGGVGNGDIWAVSPSGTISRSLPQVNSSADERQPAWSRDGRYLAVLRRGGDGHDRVLLFDFANNLVVDPAGLDLGPPAADARPLGESRPLQGGISIADDPTARTETITLTQPRFVCTTPKGGTLQCQIQGTVAVPAGKRTTVGIVVRRLRGTRKVLGRRVPRLGRQIRIPLGRLRGHARFARHVPRGLRPGRYLLTARTFRKHGRVRTLAKPRVARAR